MERAIARRPRRRLVDGSHGPLAALPVRLAVCGALAALSLPTFLWSLPLTFGYLVAVPFAVATASPVLGTLLARLRLCAIPEEFEPPAEIRAIGRGLIMVLPKGSAAALSVAPPLSRACGPQRGDGCALRQILEPGDLAFDIGAHVGDRISFRRLGARVVALEPQPGPARVLRLIHGRDAGVTLLAAAAGDAGSLTFHLNTANPTVSTASDAFLKAAEGAGGWEGQVWDEAITVPCTTLDRLIGDHGRPAFVKIDVEGFEDQVLAGLDSSPGALLRVHHHRPRRGSECPDRLAALGSYRFDVALGETQVPTFGTFVDREIMAAHLRSLPHAANSGDVYAVLA